MKYFIGIIVTCIVIAGIFFGFNLGRNSTNNNSSSSTGGTVSQSSSGAHVLDLSGQGITVVTADIYGKTNTTDLILSNNSIKTLPSQMGQMTNLVIFKIDHNVLDGSLIGEVRQMALLKNLDVSYNNMTGIPAEIGQLSKLEALNYSYNKITGLPNELSNLKNNLKTFDLTGNPLTQQQISQLKSELPNTTIIF